MPYDNTNRGAIWGSDKKETEKHPDFKGKLNVEGVDYWVSAWKRKPDQIETAPSLSFSILFIGFSIRSLTFTQI